ncbi:hypothetical protein C8R44DRAFT_743029 [Mycena epipterygia]|nr:hypothetical protein C8R44DRAFT_743029 [Mycena epipterygia]
MGNRRPERAVQGLSLLDVSNEVVQRVQLVLINSQIHVTFCGIAEASILPSFTLGGKASLDALPEYGRQSVIGAKSVHMLYRQRSTLIWVTPISGAALGAAGDSREPGYWSRTLVVTRFTFLTSGLVKMARQAGRDARLTRQSAHQLSRNTEWIRARLSHVNAEFNINKPWSEVWFKFVPNWPQVKSAV